MVLWLRDLGNVDPIWKLGLILDRWVSVQLAEQLLVESITVCHSFEADIGVPFHYGAICRADYHRMLECGTAKGRTEGRRRNLVVDVTFVQEIAFGCLHQVGEGDSVEWNEHKRLVLRHWDLTRLDLVLALPSLDRRIVALQQETLTTASIESNHELTATVG